MSAFNPKFKDKTAPRKDDQTTQGRIMPHHLRAGEIKGKRGIHIPELHCVIWVDPEANEEEIRKRYILNAQKSYLRL